MKRLSNLLLLFSVFCITGLFGCTNDNENIMEQATNFTIEVQTEEFIPQAETRVPVEEGYKTVFKGGEQIGITALKNGAVYNGMDNVPFTYDAATNAWKPTDSNVLPQLYYYPGVSYIACYPYDTNMNGKKSEQEIIDAFTPQADQSSYERYTASDLMTGTGTVTGSNGAYTITFKLEHRMSLIVVKAEGKRYVATSGYEYTSLPFDFSLKLNDTDLQTYVGTAGLHKYLVRPTDISQKVNISFNIITPISYETTYATLATGKYYNISFNYGGEILTRDLQVGDYFYTDGIIVPQDVTTVPYVKNCIGLIFKVGRFEKDDSNYINGNGEPMTEINGYVVALKDANNGASISWGKSGEVILDTNKEGSNPYGHFDGFKITQLLKNRGINNYPAANVCIGYSPKASPKSSGWFFPAGGQLLELRNTREELKKKTIFTNYNSDNYWQSTENGSGDSWSIGLVNTNLRQSFKTTKYYVRSILSF